MDDKKNTINIKKLLAEHMGTEEEEIKNNFSFTQDLNMNATDLSDFFRSLDANGYDTSKLDITELESVDDLIEALEE